MEEQSQVPSNTEDVKSDYDNVRHLALCVSGSAAVKKKREPQLSDDELLELRAMMSAMRVIVQQWPEMKQNADLVLGNCVLAQKILKGDS